jgi:hypothetical protein
VVIQEVRGVVVGSQPADDLNAYILKERDNLEDLVVDEKIILEWIS